LIVWLSDDQLKDFTKRKRVDGQCQVLNEAGIPYRMVAGRPIVMLADIGQSVQPARPRVRKLA
jgi:hypothetical protein